MFSKKQEIFTYTLTNSVLTINESDGINVVSIELLSGAGTYKGTKKIGAVSSTPTSLVVNKPITVSSDQTNYLNEFTIDASAGVIEIIAR